ncbi:hypothetical protein ACLB2K_037389 [Fragaria x ananassa]
MHPLTADQRQSSKVVRKGIFDPDHHQMHTATALSKADIKFEPVRRESIMDIRFKEGEFRRNGVLMIPQLNVGMSSETIFRNLIAIEQCYHGYSNVITSYAILMDNLISSKEDVELLCKEKVIGNWLSDEDGCKFFSNLYKDIPHKRNPQLTRESEFGRGADATARPSVSLYARSKLLSSRVFLVRGVKSSGCLGIVACAKRIPLKNQANSAQLARCPCARSELLTSRIVLLRGAYNSARALSWSARRTPQLAHFVRRPREAESVLRLGSGGTRRTRRYQEKQDPFSTRLEYGLGGTGNGTGQH